MIELYFSLCMTVWCLLDIIQTTSFMSGPGVVRTYTGTTVTLTWTLEGPLDLSGSNIKLTYINILFYQRFQNGEVYWFGGYEERTSVTYTESNKNINVHLAHVSTSDITGRFICRIDIGGSSFVNNEARIFLYKPPQTPTISPADPTAPEGTRCTLTCTATSDSVPADLVPEMLYTWTRNGQSLPPSHSTSGPGGGQLHIDPVTKDDHLKAYNCLAREQGSSNSSNTEARLNVTFKPGRPILQGPSGPVVEGDDVTLTCNLPSDQAGNPDVYSYTWRNTDTSYTQTQNTASLTVSGVTLSNHDGPWECDVNNRVGTGPTGQATVTVNAFPRVQVDLQSEFEIKYTNTLSVTCSFRARPEAVITWSYNETTTPPAGIHTPPSESSPDGKYVITNSRIQWREGATDTDKRTSGGRYQCHAENGVGPVVTSSVMDLRILYGPYNISLGNPGPITATEGNHVTLTCSSDCSPVCSYQWTRSSDPSWSHASHVMEIPYINRNRHDTYTCRVYNVHGSRNASVIINVNYASEIVSFVPIGRSIHCEAETLVCDVTSRPQSVIDIRNTSTDLVRSEGYQAVYTFKPVNVLNSGLYQCGAQNDVGARAVRDITLDVKGGFHLCSNQSASVIRGRGLSSNITEEICQFANPFLEVTEANWTFVPENISLRSDGSLPEDTFTTTGSTRHKYRKLIKLHITRISEGHFGKYTLTTRNSNGPEVLFTLNLVPEGPPESPTNLVCTRTTAVSIYLEWRPGFDGGSEQTFWVQLTITDTGDTWRINNISDSTGDVLQYKVTSEHGIQPSVTYRIHIGAFNAKGDTPGPSTTNSTKAQPQFLGESPDVHIVHSKAYITWSVSDLDSVTHIIVRSCDTHDVDSCVHTNVTDPSTQPYVVSLPEASSFAFWFDFYDGVDIVYSPPHYVRGPTGGPKPGAVAGGVTASVVVVVIVIIGILVWRKRQNKNANKQSQTVLYENAIGSLETRSSPEGSQQEHVTYEEIIGSKKDAPKDTSYEEVHDQTPREIFDQATATYESLQPRSGKGPIMYETPQHKSDEVTMYKENDVSLLRKVSEGVIFSVWTAAVRNVSVDVIVKQLKDNSRPVLYQDYLNEVGKLLVRLKSPHTVMCLGMTKDLRVIAQLSAGTLRQYLKMCTESPYRNTEHDLHTDCTQFIRQITEGMKAVMSLNPRPLFYCLSADHVFVK